MKGFRNILVHKYGETDDRIVFEAVTSRLGDFEGFLGEIRAALESFGASRQH